MLAAKASNSILTKARAKYGRRLTPKNYRDLTALGSVGDVAAYLKTHTHFAEGLAGIQESALHRGNLEKLLRQSNLKDIDQLCQFERSVGDHLFEYIVMRGEIDELLRFVRHLTAGHPEAYILDMSYRFNHFTRLDLLALPKLKSYGELAAQLRNTRYGKVMKPFEEGKLDYSMGNLESAFDRFLYGETFAMLERSFSGDTKKELTFILSLEIELSNIRRIYRDKRYYDGSAAALAEHILPYHCLLSPRQLEAMLRAADGNEVLSILRSSRYGKYAARFDPAEIDGFARRVMQDYCERKLHFSTHPAVVMACFFRFADNEVDNVTNIIEGIRYGLPPDRIGAMLVLPDKKEGDV
ncbi:MAG: V-type ATPase subunit [Clostridiales bacterium]|nr:V-type ATPase subunit [Clostridiales bacterium]